MKSIKPKYKIHSENKIITKIRFWIPCRTTVYGQYVMWRYPEVVFHNTLHPDSKNVFFGV